MALKGEIFFTKAFQVRRDQLQKDVEVEDVENFVISQDFIEFCLTTLIRGHLAV